MSVMRLIAPAFICAAVATPVSADVTLRMTMVESEIDGRVTSVTEYRKGLKMRTDSSGAAIASNSMILNLETGLVIMLWPDGKSADVIDFRRMAAPLGKNEVTQSITPTMQSRQIAGSTCTVAANNAGSETRMPKKWIIGTNTKLTIGGALRPLGQEPIMSPRAQKGTKLALVPPPHVAVRDRSQRDLAGQRRGQHQGERDERREDHV